MPQGNPLMIIIRDSTIKKREETMSVVASKNIEVYRRQRDRNTSYAEAPLMRTLEVYKNARYSKV